MCVLSVELTTKKWPVIYGAPPPPDSHVKHAKWTFMDGTHDFLGEPYLINNAATHIKCHSVASSMVVGSSRGGKAQKLKCEVVIPPSCLSKWQMTKLHQEVIDISSDDGQLTAKKDSESSSNSEYCPATNDDDAKMDNNDNDNNDNNDDNKHASLLGPARDSSSSKEFTLLSHFKKWKASLPQPSHPTLSKHVKDSVSSQPMVLLKGKEPVR